MNEQQTEELLRELKRLRAEIRGISIILVLLLLATVALAFLGVKLRA